MKTLALSKGDLSPAPGGYLMYEGAAKIQQDMSLALRESYGSDQFHPRWGSILPQLIGQPITADTRTQITTEINRVVSNYIAVQNARIIQDGNNGVVSSMTTDDVVQSVANISVQQVYDSLLVKVTLLTLSRQFVNISQVIS